MIDLTPQQIKDNAPSGATHYREYTGQYFKISQKEWLIFNRGDWRKWQSSRFINVKAL